MLKIKELDRAIALIENAAVTEKGVLYSLSDVKAHGLLDELLDGCATALAALRECRERADPQPLTLEELQAMEGDPVWVKHLEIQSAPLTCKILPRRYATHEHPALSAWNDSLKDYGITWFAYRTKPEGSESDV